MITEMQLDAKIEKCISRWLECYEVYRRTKVLCVRKSGEHAGPHHIRLMGDCANMCFLAAGAMLSESEFADRFSMLCADVCDRCAMDCERFSNDKMMQDCATICRDCAETCRDMSKVTV